MALETMVDRDLCVQAADRALAYLRERVLDDTWVAAHRDIAYYFKAPQAFLLAGLRDEAAAAFDALEPFLDEGGAASGWTARSPVNSTSCSPFPRWCSSSCTPGAEMMRVNGPGRTGTVARRAGFSRSFVAATA